MAAMSGTLAKVMIGASTLVECTGWTYTRSAILHAYASCNTSGYKKRVKGTMDSSGTLKGMFDESNFIEDYFGVGDAVTLLLYINGTDYWSQPAMIETLEIETDVDEGALIPWSSSWSGNGAWSSSGL